MLVLDSTLKSITVAMSGAAATTNPDFVVAWSDDTGSAFTEGSTDGALNGTSQVTLVAAPAASTRRLVKTINIQNKDTAAVTLTITYNNNATLRNIAKVTLQVGDTYTTDGTTDTNGNLKTTINGVTSFSAGTTGFTPSTASQGVVTLAGVLNAANGGTGVANSSTITLGGNLTTSGAYATTLTATGTTTVTLPTTGTLATLAGSETFTNKTLTNPTVTNYVETLQAVGTVGSTSTLALTTGTVLTATLTASTPCTFTMPTATAGKSFILKLIQASSGMTTATFTSVKWPGGTAPTITATASAVDILSFVSDGTNWYGTFAQAFA
jgi:hypothetical protein